MQLSDTMTKIVSTRTATRYLTLIKRCGADKRALVNPQAFWASTVTNVSPSTMLDTNKITHAKPYEELPGPRGIYNLPGLGFLFHLKPFGNYTTGTMHLLFDEMIERYGPVFKIRLDVPTVVITDPRDLSVMVRNEGKYPHRPNFPLLEVYYKRTKMDPSVGALQGEKWRALRQPTQRAVLKPRQAAQYLPMMNEVADDYVKMLRSGYLTGRDPEKSFMAFMAESSGTVFFNKRLGFLDQTQSKESKNLQNALHCVFELLYKTRIGDSNGFRYYKSKDYMTFETAFNVLLETARRYVREAKAELTKKTQLGKPDPDQPNMIFALLNEHSEKKTIQIVESLYMASIDSSASGLQIFLHTLAKNQEKQDKLRDEIRSILGDSDGMNPITITSDLLDRMTYLKACLKEVYRLHPIIPYGPTRVLPVDVELGGYKIPRGVQIFHYNTKVCNDETIFEKPREYSPERWLRENKQTGKGGQWNVVDMDIGWTSLPFGLGPRMCPGRRLFEQEVRLIVAKIIHHTRVELEPESMDVGFEYKMFIKPVKPLKFTFTPLDDRILMK